MKKRKNIFIIANIILPIFIGTLAYYLFFPEIIFVQKLDSFLGMGYHVPFVANNKGILVFLRNYTLDMMWGYALVFGLFYVVDDNNTADIWKTFLIAFLFSVIMEILQLNPKIYGYFDIWDIVVEFFAELIAVFIIKILEASSVCVRNI